jgi:hypoxanthine phosphoribosyltransferase
MKILIPADRIQHRVAELARQITTDYCGRPVTIVGVLTGSLMFVADLVRHLTLPVRIHFIQASSYRGAATSPDELTLNLNGLPDLRGRHVLLLDDILDTGNTLFRLRQELTRLGPASLRIGVLVRKADRLVQPVEADYCGFDIPDAFVVGYGLDFDDEYRNLPHIAVLATGQEAGS